MVIAVDANVIRKPPAKRLRPPPIAAPSLKEDSAWDRLLNTTLRSNSIACFWCMKALVLKKLGNVFNRWKVVAVLISARMRERSKYERDLKMLTTNSSMLTYSLANQQFRGSSKEEDRENHPVSPLTHASNSPQDIGKQLSRSLKKDNNSTKTTADFELGYIDDDFNDIDTVEIDRHAVMTKEFLDSRNAVDGADLTEEELELRRTRLLTYVAELLDTIPTQHPIKNDNRIHHNAINDTNGSISKRTSSQQPSLPYSSRQETRQGSGTRQPSWMQDTCSSQKKGLRRHSPKMQQTNLSDISRISVEDLYTNIFMDSKPMTFNGLGSNALMKRAKEIMQQQKRGRQMISGKQNRESSSGASRNRSSSAGRTRSTDGIKKGSVSLKNLIDVDYEDIERMRNWSGSLRR